MIPVSEAGMLEFYLVIRLFLNTAQCALCCVSTNVTGTVYKFHFTVISHIFVMNVVAQVINARSST